ncbi:unnamed protein product, partial [Musa acuminata var. zebrina]
MTGGGITWPNGSGDVMRYRQLLRRRRPPLPDFKPMSEPQSKERPFIPISLLSPRERTCGPR